MEEEEDEGEESARKHFCHDHPLVLEAKDLEIEIECGMCSMEISGPYYFCDSCGYYLHKVCAELPRELNHPMHHRKHPLALVAEKPPHRSCHCSVCGKSVKHPSYFYSCPRCEFHVDLACASSVHAIQDKCHPHPLTPLQIPASFCCSICATDEEGVSYKCNTCPFWAHQMCTLLPSHVKNGPHKHDLTLLKSIPYEHYRDSDKCDICHKEMLMFGCHYYCQTCLFIAHVECAMAEQLSSSDRNVDNRDGVLDQLPVLPVRRKSMDLILRFVKTYNNLDAFVEEKIHHFGHRHPLFLIDEKMDGKLCSACLQYISAPSYSCRGCGYFLHKCCAELPAEFIHPYHSEHQLDLVACYTCPSFIFVCNFCDQLCTGFGYKCFICEDFCIDIKCASLLGPIKHEAHPHALVPRPTSPVICSACNCLQLLKAMLECDTCGFKLCFRCAMSPPFIRHRYDKHQPFALTYSPIENHYNEYICELCEKELNPKLWHYYCGHSDQFAHLVCMLKSGADTNIKFGGLYFLEDQEHTLTLAPFTTDNTFCSLCRVPLSDGFSVGFHCVSCDFRIHLECVPKDIFPARVK